MGSGQRQLEVRLFSRFLECCDAVGQFGNLLIALLNGSGCELTHFLQSFCKLQHLFLDLFIRQTHGVN
jgi:hypothetical protein